MTNRKMTNEEVLIQRLVEFVEVSPESRLLHYLYQTVKYPQLATELKLVLEEETLRSWPSLKELPSWFGNELGVIPLCALMIRNSTTTTEFAKWDAALRDWENNDSDFPLDHQILGTSPDGDDFFLYVFPIFVALCIAVAGDRGEFRFKLCDRLMDILEQLEPSPLGVEMASWICNVAARCEMATQYEKARDYINNCGGIEEAQLYSPASITSDYGDEFVEQNQTDCMILCPDIHVFRERAFSLHREFTADPCQLVLVAVCNESFAAELVEAILSTLWAR